MLKIIQNCNTIEINKQLAELEKENTVTFISLSTCPAPDKQARYDTQTTVVINVKPFPQFMNK